MERQQTANEVRTNEVCTNEVRTNEVRTNEVCTNEVCTNKAPLCHRVRTLLGSPWPPGPPYWTPCRPRPRP